jgi:uncharacterized protein (UPF0261 family)
MTQVSAVSGAGPTVLLLGTLDTKGAEFRYVRAQLEGCGVRVLLADFGIFGDGRDAEYPPQVVAERGGAELASLRSGREGSDTRARALAVMTLGLTEILKELIGAGQVDAVFSLGGSGGSSVASAVMRAAPVGFPKLLVSTMASGDVSGYVGESDLTIMHSVTDILGLNRISRAVLGNAAAAVAGMAAGHFASRDRQFESRPLVALTMFGVTTPCVRAVAGALEEKGFDTVVFHAVGSGGRAMEMLIGEGQIEGVIDITTSELVDGEYGGKFAGDPTRMTVAARAGVPTVVVPGAMEVLNFGTVASVPPEFRDRDVIVHNTSVCAVRVDRTQAAHLGSEFMGRLAGANGNVVVVVPKRGFSSYSKEPDGPWVDGEADTAFIDALDEANRDLGIPVRKAELNVNDPEFAEIVTDEFLRLWQRENGDA